MKIDILNDLGLNESEKEFVKSSNTSTTDEMNQSRIISEIYFVKKLEVLTNKIISSNENLSNSNKKYARGMLWLTGALVFVGIINIAIAFIK